MDLWDLCPNGNPDSGSYKFYTPEAFVQTIEYKCEENVVKQIFQRELLCNSNVVILIGHGVGHPPIFG